MNKAARFFATLFYVGYFPKAPGTMGSLFSLLLAVPLILFGGLYIFIALLIIATLIGFWSAEVYRKEMNKEDPKEVVIDELVGQWMILLFINPTIWWHWLLAFGLFRLFDIIKPFPVDYLDKNIKGGAGIMIDDMAAAVMGIIALKICFWII